MGYMDGWILVLEDGDGQPATEMSFKAHMAHWQIESATADEITFNNAYWNDYPSRQRPEDKITVTRRYFRRVNA